MKAIIASGITGANTKRSMTATGVRAHLGYIEKGVGGKKDLIAKSDRWLVSAPLTIWLDSIRNEFGGDIRHINEAYVLELPPTAHLPIAINSIQIMNIRQDSSGLYIGHCDGSTLRHSGGAVSPCSCDEPKACKSETSILGDLLLPNCKTSVTITYTSKSLHFVNEFVNVLEDEDIDETSVLVAGLGIQNNLSNGRRYDPQTREAQVARYVRPKLLYAVPVKKERLVDALESGTFDTIFSAPRRSIRTIATTASEKETTPLRNDSVTRKSERVNDVEPVNTQESERVNDVEPVNTQESERVNDVEPVATVQPVSSGSFSLGRF